MPGFDLQHVWRIAVENVGVEKFDVAICETFVRLSHVTPCQKDDNRGTRRVAGVTSRIASEREPLRRTRHLLFQYEDLVRGPPDLRKAQSAMHVDREVIAEIARPVGVRFREHILSRVARFVVRWAKEQLLPGSYACTDVRPKRPFVEVEPAHFFESNSGKLSLRGRQVTIQVAGRHREDAPVLIGIHYTGFVYLADVTGTLHRPRLLARPRDYREKDADEQRDDPDDDEELDQRETAPVVPPALQ